MTRVASSVERPVLRLLLMALMGLALASRLALGATAPAGGSAHATDPLAKLQAAMIVCHTGTSHKSSPTMPQGPRLGDQLLFDQADNAHALASGPANTTVFARHWSAADFPAVRAVSTPPLWRSIRQARAPPPIL